jgi:hypothetical protein
MKNHANSQITNDWNMVNNAIESIVSWQLNDNGDEFLGTENWGLSFGITTTIIMLEKVVTNYSSGDCLLNKHYGDSYIAILISGSASSTFG